MYQRTCPYMKSNNVPVYNYSYHSWIPPYYRDIPESKTNFTTAEAYIIGKLIGLNWDNCPFDVEQYRIGLIVELEHGRISPETNVTNDNPILTGKITLAHLREFPDYYTRLYKLEHEAEMYWKGKENDHD